MKFISNLSVSNKLALITFSFCALILIIEFFNLNNMREQLETAKAEQSKQIVMSASYIAEHYYQQYKKGELSQEQAKAKALEAIAAIRYDETNYVFISNVKAKMLSHPIKPELNGQDMSLTRDKNGVSIFVEFANIAKNQGHGSLNYYWPKPNSTLAIEKISYVNLIEQWGWVIGTGVYTDDIHEIFMSELIRNIALLALILPIILIITYIISRNITKPIAEISQAMKRISQGDFTVTARYQSRDEIGELATSLNTTAYSLSKLVRQVEDSCSLIKESTHNAAATTIQTFDGVNRQKDQTQALAAAVNEMSMSAQEVAQRAADTAKNSRSANNIATQGIQIVESTIGKIQQVSTQMQGLQGIMLQLEQDTEEVETILNVISDISDQTNLLALNAAIEAARAGTQGRGFAVVADEVRHLAKRTQDSTGQIRGLNERLKSEFSKAVALVKEGHASTKLCTVSARDAGDHINTISLKINEILQMSDQVAISVEEQSKVADELNQNISIISTIAEQTSEGANETAQSSQSLSSMSMQLESTLQEFKVA